MFIGVEIIKRHADNETKKRNWPLWPALLTLSQNGHYGPVYVFGILIDEFRAVLNKYIPRLVCLASVRTIPRIGDQNPHFRMLSSNILIRVVQTLGWFLDLKETIRMLEECAV